MGDAVKDRKLKALVDTLQDEIYFVSELADSREISERVAERLRRRARTLETFLKAVDS